MEWQNFTADIEHSFDINSGNVVLDSSNTSGSLVIRGISLLTDNSNGITVDVRGLVFADQTQLSSFQGQVTVDATATTTGINFPFGTQQFPVNNLNDALVIANSRGIRRLFFVGDFTFDYNDDVSLKELRGESRSKTTLIFESGAMTVGTEFFNCAVEGTLASPAGFTECELRNIIGDTAGFIGTIIVKESIFDGTIILSDQLEGVIELLNCTSGVTGVIDTPVLNANGAKVDVIIRNYVGGIEIQGISNPYSDLNIDINSGDIILDSSNTDGTITLRGISKLTDNSNGSTVDISGLVFANIRDEYENSIWIDVATGSAGTGFPIGTSSSPVNNVADARIIADSVGIESYVINGSITLEEDHVDWLFRGKHGTVEDVVDLYGFDVSRSRFENIKIQGGMGGTNIITDCSTIDNVTNLSGNFIDGTFLGTVNFAETVNPSVLFNVSSGGSTAVILDVGGGRIIGGTGLRGDWIIANMSPGPPFPPSIVSLEFLSGEITLNSTNVGGSAEFAGLANLIDNSAGTTVTSTNLLQPSAPGGGAEAWDEIITDHEIPGSYGKKLTDILKLKRTQP